MTARPKHQQPLADALSEAFALGAEHERSVSYEQVQRVIDEYAALVKQTLALIAPAPPAPEAITVSDAMVERGASAARGLDLQIDRNDEAAANDWDELPDEWKTPYREQAFTVLHAALASGAAADAGDGE